MNADTLQESKTPVSVVHILIHIDGLDGCGCGESSAEAIRLLLCQPQQTT